MPNVAPLEEANAQDVARCSLRVVGDGRSNRNRALARRRRIRAVELATAGLTYQQIADELGYANRGTVHRLVRQALEAHEAESVDVLRALEVDRLDALQQSIWSKAMDGDLDAMRAVLRVIESRVRLLGLLPQTKTRRPVCKQPQTVVLMAGDCRLSGCPDHT